MTDLKAREDFWRAKFEQPERIVDIVYSPDDGGYYAEEWDFDKDKRRVTKRVYPSVSAVRKAIKSERVWERWN